MTELETGSNSFSFSISLSWTDFFQKYKIYIIIGAIVIIALIILGIWWWNKKKTPSQESFTQDFKEEQSPSKHRHEEQPEKRPINEKNFGIGKEKMKGTLQLMDKSTDDLKNIIQSIQQTKGKSSDKDNPVEELTERLEYTLNFIKKMNEQAKKFGGFLLEDARELKQYTPEFQARVDGDVKSAQEKFERAVLLVQDLAKEMSSTEMPTESESKSDSELTPESNE
jgi:FtsZ-interacting cell division protein ZipA